MSIDSNTSRMVWPLIESWPNNTNTYHSAVKQKPIFWQEGGQYMKAMKQCGQDPESPVMKKPRIIVIDNASSEMKEWKLNQWMDNIIPLMNMKPMNNGGCGRLNQLIITLNIRRQKMKSNSKTKKAKQWTTIINENVNHGEESLNEWRILIENGSNDRYQLMDNILLIIEENTMMNM